MRVEDLHKLPGWLCDHHFSRDCCPECQSTVPAWYKAATRTREELEVKKSDLANALRRWIGGQTIPVSDMIDAQSFSLQVEDQTYILTVSIPRAKTFSLAKDWDQIQEDAAETLPATNPLWSVEITLEVW